MGDIIKKFKSKRSRKISIYKIIFLIVLTFFFYYLFTQIIFKYKIGNSNQELLQYMLNDSNHHIKYNKKNNTLNDILKLILKIDLNEPTTLLESTFKKEEDNSTDIIIGEHIDEQLEETSEYVYDPNLDEITNPKVYIYSTHQTEAYANDANIGITPNVLMASYLLKEKLNKKNVKTIVETANITEFLNINGWDYSKSYKASRYFIKEVIEENPNLELIIDLHRDALSKENSTVEINNKKYAKILFVIGEYADNYKENLALAQTLNNLIKNKYPTLTRGILKKSGSNVNGIYNQDLSSKSILIELGGNENTMDEVINTVDILTEIIEEYIGE